MYQLSIVSSWTFLGFIHVTNSLATAWCPSSVTKRYPMMSSCEKEGMAYVLLLAVRAKGESIIVTWDKKITIFREKATSALAGFHAGLLSWSHRNLEFVEGGKLENPEKNPRSKDENQQQTQPTIDAGYGNRTRATVVEGERSHHCATPASGVPSRLKVVSYN